MSSIDLKTLLKENPSLKAALLCVLKWMEKNAHLPYVDTRRITQQVSKIPAIEVLGALTLLERVGKLRHAYKVVAPTNHVLTDGIYRTIDEIPEVLSDTSETQFAREEGGILPIYERTEARAQA